MPVTRTITQLPPKTSPCVTTRGDVSVTGDLVSDRNRAYGLLDECAAKVGTQLAWRKAHGG